MDNLPIIKYRVIFEDHWEDFEKVDQAWERRCIVMSETGVAPYVHTIRLGGPEFPVTD